MHLFGTKTVTLDESERQTILLALAHLAVERPGWLMMLERTALKLDRVLDGKPAMFMQFYVLRRNRVSNSLPDDPTEESFKKALGVG